MDEFSIFLIHVLLIHLCLYFFDFIFKSCSFVPYLYFLTNTGLEVSPLRVSWFTSAFNRPIQKWGTIRPRWQLAWFSAGVWITICLMPLAILLVAYTMYLAFKKSILDEKVDTTLLVEPILPGWNLPASDYGYYILSLLICSVIHELGHAMAAVRDDGHLIGMSVTLFFFIPVAMTHIDKIDLLPTKKQLRILCAGVWNNVFVALVAAILATTLPWIFYPFFDFGIGVQIKQISEGSGVTGPNGLVVGDKITKLNECHVYETVSWQDCMVKISQEPNSGFCIPDLFIKEHDESVPAKHVSSGAVDCCEESSPTHLCFEYLEAEGEPLLLPQHSCLNARRVIEMSTLFCLKASNCPQSLHCFKPSLENSTKLIRIQRSSGNVVLFLGHPYQLFKSLQVSEFIGLYKFFPSLIPEFLLKLCTFLTYFSFGIALLNVIPCFYFDGQNILSKIIDLALEDSATPIGYRQGISFCMTVLGTSLLISYVITAYLVFL